MSIARTLRFDNDHKWHGDATQYINDATCNPSKGKPLMKLDMDGRLLMRGDNNIPGMKKNTQRVYAVCRSVLRFAWPHITECQLQLTCPPRRIFLAPPMCAHDRALAAASKSLTLGSTRFPTYPALAHSSRTSTTSAHARATGHQVSQAHAFVRINAEADGMAARIEHARQLICLSACLRASRANTQRYSDRLQARQPPRRFHGRLLQEHQWRIPLLQHTVHQPHRLHRKPRYGLCCATFCPGFSFLSRGAQSVSFPIEPACSHAANGALHLRRLGQQHGVGRSGEPELPVVRTDPLWRSKPGGL